MKQHSLWSTVLISTLCMCMLHTAPASAQHTSTHAPDTTWTFKALAKAFHPNFFIGTASKEKLKGTIAMEIADREFGYITPSNDFKQTHIHPYPKKWDYQTSDWWIAHAQKHNQILRLHAPISPQVSRWAKGDERTPEELQRNLEQYLKALYDHYGNHPLVKWIDVVNETVSCRKGRRGNSPYTKYLAGDWMGPIPGNKSWENPWTKIGFETYKGKQYPKYIGMAFKIATDKCKTTKLIINQHGDFEPIVWDKMKDLVHYLRAQGYRVDGLGWQCHTKEGWQLKPGNLKRLHAFIDWCHNNDLAFHITEMTIWIKDKEMPNRYQRQADTFTAIVGTLLDHVDTGEVGLNFWNVQDNDTQHPDWEGCLWNKDGEPKKAMFALKQLLVDRITTDGK